MSAAEAEFARHGLTGARIDRIAAQAGASKERLYVYFGDKQGLFDEVSRNAVEQAHVAVPIEGDDLVAYAGHLVEYFVAHPDQLRMLTWTHLEPQCQRALTLPAVTAHQRDKADAVRRAQAAARVDTRWDPAELLQLIQAIATYWASATDTDATSASHYRGVVEEAVRRLIAPQQQ